MEEPNPVFEKNYVAHSINPISNECGRFIKVGEKLNLAFDTVWMQKEV